MKRSQFSNMLVFDALTKGEEGDSIGVETDETFPYS
jgi:hypothetical protein